jgi:hypothetical protein
MSTDGRASRQGWLLALLHALPIVALVLTLFVYWFAFADRYIVFLYNHDMGFLYPDTSPFSRVTSSRYWMAGLVASGMATVLYTAVSWLLGRVFTTYRPPAWWRVWTVCAVVLVVGIPALTMTVNEPVLPIKNAAQVAIATLVGVAIALMPGRLAARRPGELLWLAADGFGMMLIFNLAQIEDVGRWLARGGMLWIRMLVIMVVGGVVWLLVVTGLRWLLRQRVPRASTLFLAGVTVAYLIMPLVHHSLGTDGYFYITDSDNFFAQNVLVQLLTWSVVGMFALSLTWLRKRLAARRMENLE